MITITLSGDRLVQWDKNRRIVIAGVDDSSNITAVKTTIPIQATAQNQLADKAFVNSSISTATATFRDTFTATIMSIVCRI